MMKTNIDPAQCGQTEEKMMHTDSNVVKSKLTIDRFEGEYAVCIGEDEKTLNIERALIPNEAKEGSIIEVSADLSEMRILSEETAKRAERINSLFEKIKNKNRSDTK